MGAVYLAERADGEYLQEVALKVLRGAFTSSADRARFRRERQILASLEHPCIARLLDGGTSDDGQPYLVMERVVGRAVTEHARGPEPRGISCERSCHEVDCVIEDCRGAHRRRALSHPVSPRFRP